MSSVFKDDTYAYPRIVTGEGRGVSPVRLSDGFTLWTLGLRGVSRWTGKNRAAARRFMEDLANGWAGKGTVWARTAEQAKEILYGRHARGE